ncbi:hypothetical protein SNE40_016390 [Patella caerulea]|uniref:Uncharacterized protein n=1 Tax=Patella caerulea TaxID=87958 RepID=A0AAN8JE19_PATCE
MKTPEKAYVTLYVPSFTVYYQDQRGRLSSKYPFLSADQINCKIRDQWKAMKNHDKKSYTIPKLCLTPSRKSSVEKKTVNSRSKSEERRKSSSKNKLFTEIGSGKKPDRLSAPAPTKIFKQISVEDWLKRDGRKNGSKTKPQTYSSSIYAKSCELPEILDRTPHVKNGILKNTERSLSLEKQKQDYRTPAKVTFSGKKNKGLLNGLPEPRKLSYSSDFDVALDDDRENVKTTDGFTQDNVEDEILDREVYSDSDDDNLLHYRNDDDDDEEEEEDQTQESAPETPQIPDDTEKDSEEQLVPNSQTKYTKSTENENLECSATTPNKANLQKPLKSGFAIPREPARNLRPRKRTKYDENTVEIPNFKSGISPKMFGLLKNRSSQNKNITALKDSRNVTRHEMDGQNELEINSNKKPSKKTPKIKTMPGLFDEYEIEMTSESEFKTVHDKLVNEFSKFEKSNRSNDNENKEKKNRLRKNSAEEPEDNGKPTGSLDGRNIETHLEKKESKKRGDNSVDLKQINKEKTRDNPLDGTNEEKKGDDPIDAKCMNKIKSLKISGQNLKGEKRPLKKKRRDKIITSAIVKLSPNPRSNNDEISAFTDLGDKKNLKEEHMNIHVINDIQDEDMNINEHIDEEGEDININEHIDEDMNSNEDMNIHELDTLSSKFKMPSFLQPETLSSSYNDGDDSVPGNNMTGNTTLEKVLLKLRQIGSQSSPEIPADEEEGESPRLLSPTLSGVSEFSSLSEAEFKNVALKNKTDGEMVKPVKKVKANSARKRKTVVMDMFQEITPPDKKHTAKQRRLAASNKSSSASNFGILFHEEDIFL